MRTLRILTAIVISLAAVATAMSCGPDNDERVKLNLLRDVQLADDPDVVRDVYTRAVEIDGDNERIHEAYIERMLAFGRPEDAVPAAYRLLELDDDSALAWGVIAFDHAAAGAMDRAFEAMANSAGEGAEHPFVLDLAGQLLAWYDTYPYYDDLDDDLRDDARDIREELGETPAFREGYASAAEALEDQEPIADAEPYIDEAPEEYDDDHDADYDEPYVEDYDEPTYVAAPPVIYRREVNYNYVIHRPAGIHRPQARLIFFRLGHDRHRHRPVRHVKKIVIKKPKIIVHRDGRGRDRFDRDRFDRDRRDRYRFDRDRDRDRGGHGRGERGDRDRHGDGDRRERDDGRRRVDDFDRHDGRLDDRNRTGGREAIPADPTLSKKTLRQIQKTEQKAERKAVRIERKAERVERREDRKQAKAEKKAEKKDLRQQRKAERKERKADKKSVRKARKAIRKDERSERRSEKKAARQVKRVERKMLKAPRKIARQERKAEKKAEKRRKKDRD